MIKSLVVMKIRSPWFPGLLLKPEPSAAWPPSAQAAKRACAYFQFQQGLRLQAQIAPGKILEGATAESGMGDTFGVRCQLRGLVVTILLRPARKCLEGTRATNDAPDRRPGAGARAL
ncbi:MAG TPA: hypothetical protein V6D00_01345, partial [Pantanalinema sp.]